MNAIIMIYYIGNIIPGILFILNNTYLMTAAIILFAAAGLCCLFFALHISHSRAKGEDISSGENETEECSFLRKRTLTQLVKKGFEADEALYAELARCGISFKREAFQVAIVLIEDINQQLQPDFEGPEDIDDIGGVLPLIADAVEPAFAVSDMEAYVCNLYSDLVVIINYDCAGDKNGIQDKCRQLWEQIIGQLYSESGVVVSVCVGLVGRSLEKLPILFQQAKALSEHSRILEVNEPVVSLFEMRSHVSILHAFNGSTVLELEKQFITCMQIRNMRGAKACMNKLIEAYLGDENSVPAEYETTKYRLYGLINSMLCAVDSIRLDVDSEFFSYIFPAVDIKECHTHTDFQSKANYIFDQLIEYYDNRTREQPPSWYTDVKKYIDEQIDEPTLNISMVAMAFDLNPAYASRIFRIYEGMGILDYIHVKRVRLAKSLLSSGMTVAEVAEKVGFGNTRTMSRAFVKFEGITPGNFRK